MSPAQSGRWGAVTALLLLMFSTPVSPAFGQTPPRRTCLPISERAGRDVGCWLIVAEPLGQLPRSEVFWHLDTYATRPAAETAKGPRGTVVEALGRVWLFTIAEAGWRASGGVRVAEVGPIFVKAGEQYTAQYAEGISNPGDVTPKHRHPGPEIWYTTAGGFCAEASDGKTYMGTAGHGVVIQADHTGWSMMMLVATGPEVRRSIFLVLHQSAHNWTAPAPEWTPKGLCNR
jgi:quercetin dioxygenase-like cupin family protein